MTELLSLPDHVLEMIALKTATRYVDYEESWGTAALTCKRLYNLQLPGECVAVDTHRLPWLLLRVKDARTLCVDDHGKTGEGTPRKRSVDELFNLFMEAPREFPQLHVLVLRLTSSPADSLLYMWMELLLESCSLHTLEYDMGRRLRLSSLSPSLCKMLKHLHLTMHGAEDCRQVWDAFSSCEQLETLSVCYHRCDWMAPLEVPSTDLRALRKLQHLKLRDIVPRASEGLLLPPGCAVHLGGSTDVIERCNKQWAAGGDVVTVLSMYPAEPNRKGAEFVVRAWPEGVEKFPALKHLRLDCDQMIMTMNTLPQQQDPSLDLGVFAHIPYVSIRSKKDLAVTISTGSWQLLELEGVQGFHVSIPDMYSFLRGVSVFAFSLPSDCMQSVVKLKEACQSAHVPLHEQQHNVLIEQPEPSCYKQLTRLSNDVRFVRDASLNSSALMGVWPADPVELVRNSAPEGPYMGTYE